MNTEERVAYLELYCRRLTFAVGGMLIITVAALLFAVNRRADEDVVRARAFIVANADGAELVRIGQSEVGPGAIVLRDAKGRTMARLEGTATLGGSLSVNDADGKPRLIAGNDEDMGGCFLVTNAQGQAVTRIGDVGHGGSVDVYQAGRHVGFLCVDPKLGSGNLSLYDDERRLMVSAHGDDNGQGFVWMAKH